MAGHEDDFLPPTESPPLLSVEQLKHIIHQGWLPLDLPEDLQVLITDLSASAAGLFDLNQQDKENLYPASQGTESGFYHVPDEKEYITFRHRVHEDSELEGLVRRTWQRTAGLLHRILCDLSRAGLFGTAAWDSLVQGALDIPKDGREIAQNITLMRLFRYYPTTGFATEHTDIGLLTLCVGDGNGLQVSDKSQTPPAWTDVRGPVILIGDTVRALFQSRVRAGLHRVVGNPEGRSSFVFALRPCLKGTIDLSQFDGEGCVNAKDYFYNIKGRKWNINATKDIRDEQRKKQNERKLQSDSIKRSQLPEGQG